jgi:hypothetical protein
MICSEYLLLQLPDTFKEFAIAYTGGKGPNKFLMTHCHREIFHAQWKILLDDEFLAAYEHGILIQCQDGIIWRIYPRIFTYSADLPEKYIHSLLLFMSCTNFCRVLVVSIRNRGICPCPRCLVTKSELSQFGTQLDMDKRTTLARVDNRAERYDIENARRKIYQGKFCVNTQCVEDLLKGKSRVPTLVRGNGWNMYSL